MSSFDGLMERAKKNYPGSFTRNITENRGGSTQAAVSTPQRTVTTSSFDGLFERAKENYADSFRSEEQRSTVVDWMDRYNRVMQGVSAYDKKRNGGYTQDASGGFGTEIDSLIADFDNIKGYAADYGFLNTGNYLDQLKQLQSSIQGINDYFSQFGDDETYSRHMAYYDKYRGKGHEDIEKILSGMDDGYERDWLETNRYDIYKTAPDYQQRSQTGLAAFENSKPKDQEEESWFEAIGRYLGKASDTTMALGDTGRMAQEYRKDTTYREPADNWTDDQRNTYGYLYSINPEAASDFAVKTSEGYRQADNQQKLGVIQEWATKNGVNASAGTVAAIAMMPLSLADTLNALTEYNARGTISTPSSPTPGQVSEAITGAVGQSLNDKHGTISSKIPVIGGKGWGDAYQLGTSIANSLLSAYTQGSIGTDILFFGSSAASTMYSKKQQGATDEQAIKMGVLAGLAEAAGEHFSIEGLINMNEADTMKAFFGNVLKQSGIEASEEGFTTLMNNFADQLIMGKDSAFYEKVRTYMSENGMSEQEAKKQAWKDMAEDLAFDMVGGAISGGVSTGIQTGAQKIFGGTQQAQTHHEPLATEKSGNATAVGEKSTPGGVTEQSAAVDGKLSATESTVSKTSGKNESSAVKVGISKMETVQQTADIDSFAQQFGTQAEAVKRNYMDGQDLQEYEVGFQTAYAMGLEGGKAEALASVPYLNQSQRDAAYNLGRAAADNVNTGVDNVNAGVDNVNDSVDNANAVTTIEDTASVAEVAAIDTDEVAAAETGNVGSAVQISTGKNVEVSRISSISKDGSMTLELSDGTTVDAGDIQHRSEGEAVLYEAVAAIGADAEVSNILVNNWKNNPGGVSAEQYTAGMIDAFNYGRYHVPQKEMADNKSIQALTPVQRNSAYALGKSFGGQLVQTQEANARRAKAIAKAQSVIKESAQKKQDSTSKKKTTAKTTPASRVNFDRKGKKLNPVQESSLQVMEMLAQATGTKFHVYESYVKNGKRVYKDASGKEKAAPNGWYEDGTGEIHIDLNAGLTADGTMLYTTAHELTHFIREWSPAKFDTLAEVLFEQVYKEKDISVIGLIREQQAKALRTGREISFDEAYEEVVADSMESILTSGNVVDLMAQVKQRDQTLWEKIREWFKNLAEDIRKLVQAYSGHKPDSPEGRAVASMKDMLPILEGFYADALDTASANFQAAESRERVEQTGERKYSYAGENARTADLDQLATAKAMQQEGVSNETIRQQTGWFMGRDGKWRFEIDDSNMRVDQHGDARGAVSYKWALEDLESARDELWGHADMETLNNVRAYNRAILSGDTAEENRLHDLLINGTHAHNFSLYAEAREHVKEMSQKFGGVLHSGGQLADYVQHDALYEAYPQLQAASFRFGWLPDGTRGQYNPDDNSIIISKEIADSPERTIIHEIQHAIQKAEGFASGSSPEYWETRQRSGDSIGVNDQKIDTQMKHAQEILDSLPEDVAAEFRDWYDLNSRDENKGMVLAQELSSGQYGAQFNDYFMTTWTLEDLVKYNYSRGSNDLYRNTAGEIEARDTANRWQAGLDAEGRKNTPPDLGDDKTVFAEGYVPSDEYISGVVSETEIENNISTIAEMTSVASIKGDEFKMGDGRLLTDVTAFFESIGGTVYNKRLGDIFLRKRGVRHDLGHGMSDEKAASFAAIPTVLENGHVAGFVVNKGGKGFDSATVVAPITIKNEPYMMGVIVHRSNKENRFYVHDVVAIKEEAAPLITGTHNVGETGGATSTISIIRKILSVKANQTESGKKDSLRKKMDQQYLDAVNRGDMRTAEKLVEEAAKQWGAFLNNSEANEVFPQSGEVRTFYHGTNTGDFTVFDKGLLGNSSGDLGWFGKGFYFAFSADEANAYGGRVIRAYLKMKNPYDYSQLYKFKGSDRGDSRYARFAWLYNIVKQFPDIVTDQKVYAYPNDSEEGKAVSWKQLVRWMDRIEKDAKFSVAKVELSNGDTAWELRANPKQESFTNEDGETFTWTEYGMRQLFATEMDAKEPINQIGAYLVNVMGVESIPRRSIEKIDFSGAIQRAGYDGILQSPVGDEAVVFDSAQIKLTDPVTYDDDGNIIPISKRFDRSKPDIRYSHRDPLQEKAAQALEMENQRLREDVKGLKDLVKLQGKLTGGKIMNPSSIEKAARVLKKNADAKGDTKELAQLLTDFYSYISGSPDLTWEGVKEAAQKAADWLWENRREEVDEYSAEILQDLRTRSISLSDSQKAEAAVTHDTFGNYRKSLFGSVKITKDGMSLDETWHELASLYPGVFDENMNANDMPAALADIVSRLKSSKNMAVAYDQDILRQALIRDVYDSYWNVSTLHTVADVKQKEINALKGRHAQQMSDLRAKHRDKVAELRKERSDAVAAVRASERQKAKSRTEKALKKYQDNQELVAANRAERKGKTALRRQIRKTVFELEKLLNRGDKKKNVKSGMTSMVDSVLKLADALFMDEYTNRDMLRNGVGVELTDAEEKLFREAQQILQQAESGAAIEGMEFTSEVDAMNQLKKLDQKLSSKMAGLKDVFTRERKRLYGTTVSDLLGKLADEYSRLSEAEDGAVRAAKDENVYAHLLQLQKDVGGTTVRDMTLGQMEAVADAFTMVLTTVRNANKMFAKNLKFKRDTLAGMVMGEIGAAVKKVSKLIRPGKNAVDTFSWNNLKPVYAFERLGSETLKTLYQNIRSGQDVWSRDMQEADDFRREQHRKHNRKAWDLEKQHRFEFESGIVELSLEQIMSLYAYSRREQALDHLLKGGFVFSGSTEVMVKEHGIQRRYLKKDATAYNLTADELLQVVDTLTKEQKAFVEEMQTYLSDVMGGKGNEISLQMYGIRSYGEKNYFPIRSAGQYMERAKEDSFRKEQGQISIVNSGFTKSTTPKANNPITLDGFMNVWAEHVNDMSMYHGFALPMEDFRRVYNYSSPNMEVGNSQSVNAVIENAFGKAATGYIDQLYKDLNGGALTDNREGISKKLVGLHKKAAVFASASVVVQQPSAIVRAFALIDPRHFIGPKVDRKRHKELWEEVKKYAPVAFVKEMGYFDTGMGRSARDFLQAEEYSGIREKMTALFKDADYRDEILGKAPALADELTWCSIWEAVKRETKAKNPSMDVRSDAFLQIAGARFSEVIDKTQVYDSVLSRSANMRSKSGLMNMVTSFLAEPTTSINMLEDALRKGDRQQLKRTVGAVYGSVLLNSLLVSLVYAARDDDEDETWWEKYLSSVAVEMMDGINPITYYPILRDIWSIGQGFDVERADMTLISDFADAAKNVIASGMKLRDAAEEEKAAALAEFKDSLWSMTDTVASLTGLPVKNIRRDIEGARNMLRTIQADLNTRDTTKLSLMDSVLGDVMNSIPIGGLLYSKNKRDRLYGALVAGDAAYVQRLKAGYESDNAYHSAIKMALRDNDSRIWEAAVAWNAGDMEAYIRIAKEIRGENRFDQDDIVLAIRAEAGSMVEKESSNSDKVYGYFTNEKFGVAMGQNNTSMADVIQQDLIDTAMANGKTWDEAEESVRSTARSQLKQLYAAGTITGANAEKMLVKYGGYSREDAADKVAEWKFETEYGFAYSDRGEAYKNGSVSKAELRQMLMDFGGKTREEADLQIQVYDWETDGYDGATIASVREYNEYCASYNVPKDVYLHIKKVSNNTKNDVDANGKPINYSAMKKIMAEIGAQYSLTSEQKYAVARSLGWSEKNIEKYKTW